MVSIKSVEPKVKELLDKYPDLRDNDQRLMANFWLQQLKRLGHGPAEFLLVYSKGNLSSSESITRARRKIQEQYPELRGELWSKRHAKQDEVIQELKDI